MYDNKVNFWHFSTSPPNSSTQKINSENIFVHGNRALYSTLLFPLADRGECFGENGYNFSDCG